MNVESFGGVFDFWNFWKSSEKLKVKYLVEHLRASEVNQQQVTYTGQSLKFLHHQAEDQHQKVEVFRPSDDNRR